MTASVLAQPKKMQTELQSSKHCKEQKALCPHLTITNLSFHQQKMAARVTGKRTSRLEVATSLIIRRFFLGKKLTSPVRTKELTC